MIFLAVFTGMVVLDAIWALYIKNTAKGAALGAACLSVPIAVIGGGLAVAYVSDPTLLFAAALGAFVGTYITTKYL